MPSKSREGEALRLLAQGRSNKDIAHQMGLGIESVKRYIALGMARACCTNRVQLALHLHGIHLSVKGEFVYDLHFVNTKALSLPGRKPADPSGREQG